MIPENPKLDTHPDSTTVKAPDNGVSRDAPMTGAQAYYLTALCEEAQVEPPILDLSKAEASKRIEALKARLGQSSARRRGNEPAGPLPVDRPQPSTEGHHDRHVSGLVF